jgi:hypothetical protein
MPAAFYEELVQQSGAGQTATISGHPAFAVAEDEQAPGYPRTSVVALVIDGIEVALHAHMPVEELTSVAETVA